MPGLLVASPMSGSGKTTFTLGLLRALKQRGTAVAPGKAGPDYIDPAFHSAASDTACLNYDPWAMRPELLLAQAATAGERLLVVEAMMGLFDASADATGSAADLAALLQLPVVLVVNCARLSHSVAALVHGFCSFDPRIAVAGIILNNVGSDRHEAMLRDALATQDATVFGVLRRQDDLVLPERHLGLVQAEEHGSLERFIDQAARLVEHGCDLDALVTVGHSSDTVCQASPVDALSPPGQRVAVARDRAFAFSYEHLLRGWQSQGAQIDFFSPLADEGPPVDSDAVYLPGGYPELHAGRIAAAGSFRQSMARAARLGVPIYGECGGYMVLGEGLIDAAGNRHAMLGLLPLTTSFAEPRLHLGYRRLAARPGFFWNQPLSGHEFHYASVVAEGAGDRLFDVEDARGVALQSAGLRGGSVAGSFMHVIDQQAPS